MYSYRLCQSVRSSLHNHALVLVRRWQRHCGSNGHIINRHIIDNNRSTGKQDNCSMVYLDNRTNGQQDNRTKSRWDNVTTGQLDNGTMGHCDNGTTGQLVNGTLDNWTQRQYTSHQDKSNHQINPNGLLFS